MVPTYRNTTIGCGLSNFRREPFKRGKKSFFFYERAGNFNVVARYYGNDIPIKLSIYRIRIDVKLLDCEWNFLAHAHQDVPRGMAKFAVRARKKLHAQHGRDYRKYELRLVDFDPTLKVENDLPQPADGTSDA